MDLRVYEQRKFELAEVLRSGSGLLPREEHAQHQRIRVVNEWAGTSTHKPVK
jgi:hypothetical protein